MTVFKKIYQNYIWKNRPEEKTQIFSQPQPGSTSALFRFFSNKYHNIAFEKLLQIKSREESRKLFKSYLLYPVFFESINFVDSPFIFLS